MLQPYICGGVKRNGRPCKRQLVRYRPDLLGEPLAVLIEGICRDCGRRWEIRGAPHTPRLQSAA